MPPSENVLFTPGRRTWAPVAIVNAPEPPGFTARPAASPVAVMSALISTLRAAVSVSSVLALQLTAALTNRSPASSPSVAVISVTLPPARLADKVLAPMPELVAAPLPADTVKLVGSMSQVPWRPLPASVATRVASSICTKAADVSTWPPRPCSARALIWPPSARLPAFMSALTVIWPASPAPWASAWMRPLDCTWSPVIQIWPARSSMPLARTMPLLFTSDCAMASAEAAVMRTLPPSARMAPRLSTSPALPGVITAEISPEPLMLTVAARPEASTTEPASTCSSPRLSTRCPNRAR